MRNLKLALAVASLLAFACPALAQNEFKTPAAGKTVVGFQVMCQDGSGNAVPCSATFPLNIAGSLTASLSGFHPETSLAQITASVGGATSATFTAGKDVLAQNTGTTNAAYCFPGNAASAFSEYIPPGGSALIHTILETTVTCVTTSSTTALNLQVGTGLWTGAGAGGGSGGGGGNVNLTQILGAAPSVTNPLWVSPATGATFPISAAALPLPAGAATQTTSAAILSALGTPFQAGASIGNTSFGATQSGTWNINNIAGTISLPTGAATSALQTTGNTSLGTIATNSGLQATAANQTTANTSLGTIATNSGTQATAANQAAGNASLATIATNSAAPLPGQANLNVNIGSISGVPNVTPTDCSGTVTTGGTSQTPISASSTLHGFTIANVDAAAGSGEPIWISFTGTASAANGSYPLPPPTATTFAAFGSYTTPIGFGANHAVSIFAATTGHKFSCTTW